LIYILPPIPHSIKYVIYPLCKPIRSHVFIYFSSVTHLLIEFASALSLVHVACYCVLFVVWCVCVWYVHHCWPFFFHPSMQITDEPLWSTVSSILSSQLSLFCFRSTRVRVVWSFHPSTHLITSYSVVCILIYSLTLRSFVVFSFYFSVWLFPSLFFFVCSNFYQFYISIVP